MVSDEQDLTNTLSKENPLLSFLCIRIPYSLMDVGKMFECLKKKKDNVYMVYCSRSVGLTHRCTLESPGESLKILLSWPNLRPLTSEFLRVGPRRLLFLNLPTRYHSSFSSPA